MEILNIILKGWIEYDPITPDIYSAVIGVILALSVTVSISMAILDTQNKKTYFGINISGPIINLIYHIFTWIILIFFLIVGTFYLFPFKTQLAFCIISAIFTITSILLNTIAKKFLSPLLFFYQKKKIIKTLQIDNAGLNDKQIQKKNLYQSKILERITNTNDVQDIWRMYQTLIIINKTKTIRKSIIVELEEKISLSIQHYISFIKADINKINFSGLSYIIQSSIDNLSFFSMSSSNIEFLLVSHLSKINQIKDIDSKLEELFKFFNNIHSFLENSKSTAIKPFSKEEVNKIFNVFINNSKNDYLFNNILTLIFFLRNTSLIHKKDVKFKDENMDLINILGINKDYKSSTKASFKIKKDYDLKYLNQIFESISFILTDDIEESHQYLHLLEANTK